MQLKPAVNDKNSHQVMMHKTVLGPCWSASADFWQEEIPPPLQATLHVRTNFQKRWCNKWTPSQKHDTSSICNWPTRLLGLITQTFIMGNGNTTTTYNFPTNRPNANTMFHRATNTPCSLGIQWTADANWKTTKSQTFFSHSYMAPTPSMHTIQQLGLGITKTFSLHI